MVESSVCLVEKNVCLESATKSTCEHNAGGAAPRLKSPQALPIGVEDGFEGGGERE